jgi:hypothetical protein
MNGVTNGSVYSPKYHLHDKIKYDGKTYMVFEVDTMNERYGLIEFNPMYVNGHSVDKSATQVSGGRGRSKYNYKRKRYSRKTKRVFKKYYF